MQVEVQINLKPHQLAARAARKRFDIRVWARRSGKTFSSVAEQLETALTTARPDWRGYYIAPTRVQAKRISWDYAKRFSAGIPSTGVNESELRIDFWNGSRIQLLGAEDYDTLRGVYIDDLILDEAALVPSAAWSQVLLPALADRQGRALVQGTPMGRLNLFHELWDLAAETPDDWSRSLIDVYQAGMIKPDEIKRLRASMREEEYAQEMECSWNAAIRGAYYAREMAAMEREGRITTVKYDRQLPVVAALDLGHADTMPVGFWQMAGTEHRCILCRAYERTSIPDMIADWRNLPFPVETVVLPHDARVTELGTGKTRQDVFHALGCRTVLAPRQSIDEGIEQVRNLLPNVWMDREGCKTLVEALNAYRSEYDEVRRVHRMTPIHDWSSHFADMARYYALGRPQHIQRGGWGARDMSFLERITV